ncbi:conserved hypothetical protein [Methanocella paludicola SANAE]|uniref:DUF354 domain-containing protein n=1 Tax=Methanocella paludicola (strain DSM 17711 / JCM 13418 / NBRC 101707 / SANAE) TaxID=304371 RepID=D1YWM9_METPS|nr:DUF354 domain-containing protein [Methanocella paludicola]BAI60851.1 conserved hypothetical protein [Methanocella paludicola SANAE]
MRIVVDINHPAHVHYFKNFIWQMQKKGHETLITASEKDISYKLLNNYEFDYIKLGAYGKSLSYKILNIPALDVKMYGAVKKFNPDVFLGQGSIRGAHVSKLMNRPSIALDDTEHAKLEHMLYVPFTDAVLTSTCFRKDFGKKQVRYNGYTELLYLHPNCFKPDPAVLDEVGLSKNDNIIILRFVSWDANHDVGQNGLSREMKHKFVKDLEKYGRVLITSEVSLDKELEKYKMNIKPERLHDLLYYSTLYIGEGATTASESAVLGTHAIYVNTLRLGYTDEEETKYGLVYNFSDKKTMDRQAFSKAMELLQNNNLRSEGKAKREKLLRDKIDVTAFLMNFIENYQKDTISGRL